MVLEMWKLSTLFNRGARNIVKTILFGLIMMIAMVQIANAGAVEAIKESFRPKSPYTMADKAFMTFAVGSQVMDYVSTKDAFSRGCVEANPMFGEDPSDATLIAGKLLASTVIVWMGNNIENHTYRKWWYGTMGLISTAVVVHNYNVTCH